MDSNRSSPYQPSAFKHTSRQSNGDSYLDPIILYNPTSTSRNNTQPMFQTESTAFRNTHRRKIFDTVVTKTENTGRGPVPQEVENKAEEMIVEKLNGIENKIRQIQGFIEKREEKSKEQKQEIENAINKQHNQSQQMTNSQRETDQKLLNIINQKQQCQREVNKLKEVIQDKDRKMNQIKSHQKQKQALLNKNLQVQLLAYERDRSWLEYERMKKSVTKREDYQNEIKKIKRRVERKGNYAKMSLQSESVSNQSFILRQFIPKPRSAHRTENKSSSIINSELITKVQQIVQTNFPKMQNQVNSELYITQSEIYFFDQQSWLQLV